MERASRTNFIDFYILIKDYLLIKVKIFIFASNCIGVQSPKHLVFDSYHILANIY